MARRLLPYGDRGLLLECADLAETTGVLRALQALDLPEVTELVPGSRTIFLRCHSPLGPQRRQQLLTLPPVPPDSGAFDQVEIAVHYDGEDLPEVADRLDLTPDEVISAHTGQRWTVGFCGFAPASATCWARTTDCGSPVGTGPGPPSRLGRSAWPTSGRGSTPAGAPAAGS